jgi:hypothetical protein
MKAHWMGPPAPGRIPQLWALVPVSTSTSMIEDSLKGMAVTLSKICEAILCKMCSRLGRKGMQEASEELRGS